MRGVSVAGIGMTAFGRHLDRNLQSLSAEAVSDALADAGLQPGDVQAAYVGNAFAGITTGQEAVRGQVSLLGAVARGIPIYNVENACASSATGFQLAWLAVAAGQVDTALVLGVEKLFHEDRTTAGRALRTAGDVVESAGQPNYFMRIYANRAAAFAERSGATPLHFAMVSMKNRRHGSLNPLAHHRIEVTLDEVLESTMIEVPLTRLMCSPIADGAAAVVLRASDLDRGRRAIPVRAAVVIGGGLDEPVPRRAAKLAYERAGVGPEDLDLVELHDGASPAELDLYEQLGLCRAGEAVRMIATGESSLGGRLPVNSSGGLLARGHPVGATGIAQVHELVCQIRGEAGARQIPNARVGLAENAGGYVGGDTAAGTAIILGR